MTKSTSDSSSEGEMMAEAAANLLLLLPRGRPFKARAFGCKTCGKTFPTFQALGGHRTGHAKPRALVTAKAKEERSHDCPLCGMSFAMGQALGGHMRRHRLAAAGELCLELSLSPPGSPAGSPRDLLSLRLGVET